MLDFANYIRFKQNHNNVLAFKLFSIVKLLIKRETFSLSESFVNDEFVI